VTSGRLTVATEELPPDTRGLIGSTPLLGRAKLDISLEAIRRFKKQPLLLLRQLGSLALLALIVSFLDFQHIGGISSRINVPYLLGVIGLVTIEHMVIAARWPILVRVKGHHVSFWEALKIDLVSSYFGMALPSLAAGDAVRGYRLFRLIDDFKTSFSCIVFDRLIGLATLGLTAIVSLFLGWRTFGLSVALVGLSCFLLFISMISFLTASSSVLKGPEYIFPALQKSQLWKYLSAFHEALREYRSSTKAILVVILLSIMTQICRVLVVYTTSLSLGLTPPFFLLVLFIPIVFAVKMLPISIGGLGAREATFSVLFMWAGLTKEDGVLVGLTISLLTVLYALVGGIVYLCHRPPAKKPSYAEVDS
jgi:glycosyltransferase 2 family protein